MRIAQKSKIFSHVIPISILVLVGLIFGIVFMRVLKPIGTKTYFGTKTASASKLTLATDKDEYSQGEIVAIFLTNNSSYPMRQQTDLPVDYSIGRYLGESFGVGLIERLEKGDWVVVEPVWRCDNSCFKECLFNQSIKEGETKTFKWNQEVHICDKMNNSEIVEHAESGTYRVFTPVWNEDEQAHKLVYSEEFTIK